MPVSHHKGARLHLLTFLIYQTPCHLKCPFLTCDVMTSMDAMKRSAMMDTPRNMYMSETK